MSISRVYMENIFSKIISKKEIIGSIINLGESAYHHMVRVCRHKLGDNIILFDGSDNDEQFLVEIVSADKRKFQVKILDNQITNTKSSLYISLFPALSRGKKFDFILQKSVELGVREITPVLTKYTQSYFNLKDEKKLSLKLDHWRKIIVSAAEQCGLNVLPTINNPIFFRDIFNFKKDLKIFMAAGPLEINKLKNSPDIIDSKPIEVFNGYNLVRMSNSSHANNFGLVFGPEGGFSLDELLLSHINKISFICLGGRILRMETVPIALLSIFQAISSDF